MAKIRHIAIRAEDPDATAKMFVEVFGLQFIQKRAHGPVDLSDGDVNITVLPMNIGQTERKINKGYEHIGFSVENEEETRQRLLGHGAKELNPVRLGEAYYESKYMSPEGLVIDVGHWVGTSPIDSQATVGATKN
jgi:catechol 2,3-dioxygenase-like lactoylglutathione lyase family enzyme